MGPRGQRHEGLVSAGHRRPRGDACSSPGTPSATAPRGCRWSTPRAGRYGHVALVTKDGKPIKTHAGGLAWRDDLLYVADTTRGLRLFDLTRFAGAALPQAGWYRPVEKGLRFSYASVDWPPASLLVGEYTDKVPGARLVRWPFAPGGLLAQEPAERRVGDRAQQPPGRGRDRRALLMAASRGQIARAS